MQHNEIKQYELNFEQRTAIKEMKKRHRHILCYKRVKGIPISEIMKAVNTMDYASTERIMFQFLCLLGCRIQELNNMKLDDIYPYDANMYIVYWKKGKNQKGYRSELITKSVYYELAKYRETHKIEGNKLFGATGQTFVRYFNRDIRPMLGGEWIIKAPNPENHWKIEYVYQIKGLRKTFVTYSFKEYYEKWKNPDMALEEISKQMGHKTKRMTSMHYLQETKELDIDRYFNSACQGLANIINQKDIQLRIFDYN